MRIRRNVVSLAVTCLALLVFGAARASAQTATSDFEDGTDQGWGTGFGNDASASFTIANVGGSLRMFVPLGGFQVAGNQHGADGSPLYLAMQAAAANEAGATISYDYYIDTSTFGGVNPASSFFQLGTFVNTGSGYYAQDFGGVKEFELSGAQLATGGVFSGHVSINMATVGYDMPAADTFFRLGLIENGDGTLTGAGVYFDNITVSVVPEPASMVLFGLGGLGLAGAAYRRSRR